MNTRAGKMVTQPGGYKAFIPKLLPPDPPIKYDDELQSFLSKADRALARLDGIITVLPNPELFIAMYVKKEALLSSQIEGTQASLEGVLEFEADLTPKDNIKEVKDVINYIKALYYGIKKVKTTPISLALIKQTHTILIKGTRGSKKGLGEFRRSQNWIGPSGISLIDALFIPPPPDEVVPFMKDLEKFILKHEQIPPLIKIALIHAQFETIHPFIDGNGRIGRLLITFYLITEEILSKPILYLSFYLKKNRQQYYDLLMKIRQKGAWEEWIKFFLKGVHVTSNEAAKAAKEIIKLKGDLIMRLYKNAISSIYAVRLIDLLFETPIIDARNIIERLKVSKDTGHQLINKFEQIGIITELTGKERYKKYLFKEYVNIIARGTK